MRLTSKTCWPGAPNRHTELRETVLAGNSELAAARLAVELAEKEIRLQEAGHFPTVDLIAQRQKAASDTVTTIGSTYFTNLWGVQVKHSLVQRRLCHRLDPSGRRSPGARSGRARCRAGTNPSASWPGAGVARGRPPVGTPALAQAERSATAALEGSEKGVRAGTEVRSFDILNARQQLFEARQARVRAAAGSMCITCCRSRRRRGNWMMRHSSGSIGTSEPSKM